MDDLNKELILKKFGNHLKMIRNEKKISLRVLEQLSSVDYSQIHRIEKGVTVWRLQYKNWLVLKMPVLNKEFYKGY